jgi:hypothetical protein
MHLLGDQTDRPSIHISTALTGTTVFILIDIKKRRRRG